MSALNKDEVHVDELKLVKFRILGHNYAANIDKVQEITMAKEVTKVNGCHTFVEGVIKWRDQIIPVISLPVYLELDSHENKEHRDIFIVIGFYEKSIAIVTFNTDNENAKRIAYVGSNYSRSGETAAGLMNLMTKDQINLGIVYGSVKRW